MILLKQISEVLRFWLLTIQKWHDRRKGAFVHSWDPPAQRRHIQSLHSQSLGSGLLPCGSDVQDPDPDNPKAETQLRFAVNVLQNYAK